MNLEKLKEVPKQQHLILITILTSIPFFILTIMFIINEFRLISSTGYGILDFELAWTPGRAQLILSAWGQVEIQNQIIMHYIDYLYILFYGLFGAELILIASRRIDGKIQKLGLYFTFTPMIAGIFDALENINLLLMLNDITFINSGSPFFASSCAVIKIGFIILSLCFIYIAMLCSILKKPTIKNIKGFLTLGIVPIIICGLFALWNPFLALYFITIYLILLYFIINFNSKDNN